MRRFITCVALCVALLAPAPAGAQPQATGTCGGMVRAWRVYMSLPPVFDTIAWRESRCQWWAVSPGGDRGVWQIAPVTRRWCANLLGPNFDVHHIGWNALCAHELYVRYGLRPWRATAP